MSLLDTQRQELLTRQIADAVHQASISTPRAEQQADHRLGVSDLGVCREYARLMTVQADFTDDHPDWAAFIGTALGDHIEAAIATRYPEARRHTEVDFELPMTGARVTGHPDLLLPNGVIDVKTTAKVSVYRQAGVPQNHQFQRHLYYYGALKNGLIDTETGWVANAYFDRSGGSEEPYIDVEPYRPDVVAAADEWLSDVIYAVRHGEKASKDKPIQWCAKACPFYTACRAEDLDATGLIEDEEIYQAVQTYLEGQRQMRAGVKMRDDAKRALEGINGVVGGQMVRWIHVNGGEVPGFTRASYDKIDIRPVPKG